MIATLHKYYISHKFLINPIHSTKWMTKLTIQEAIRKRIFLILSVCVFGFGFIVFLLIIILARNDMLSHAGFIVKAIEAKFLPPNFLYYLSVSLVTFFSTNIKYVLIGSVVVLAAALTLKFWVTVRCAAEWIGISHKKNAYNLLLFSSLGLLFLFCLPLPGQNWYLGQFPPNIWHNSTTIFLMPFAILLFFYSYKYLDTANPNVLYIVTIYTVLNVLIKPSFFFSFALIFPIFGLFRFGFRKSFLQACLPVTIGAIGIIIQYFLIYHNPEYNKLVGSEGTTVAIGWLYVWRSISTNIPLSIFNSLLLPLLFMLGYPKTFFSDNRIRYAFALLLAGMIIFAVFYETGNRAFHGNFGWQNIISNYLLHFTIMIVFIELITNKRYISKYDYLLIGVFIFEVIIGIAYVIKYIATGEYLY